MPYALYIPSSASEQNPATLIVWLHGVGEVGADEDLFRERGLLNVMNGWSLEGFNTYVLCPHLTSTWNSGHWNTTNAVTNLQCLLNYILSSYPIDANNVVIAGHSMGGHGAEYMALNLPEYFSKLVVMCGFYTTIPRSQITIPTIGFVGSAAYGEEKDSIDYMKGIFANDYGEENIYTIDAVHGNVPFVAFNEDKDQNNRSDLIEWMFGTANLSDTAALS